MDAVLTGLDTVTGLAFSNLLLGPLLVLAGLALHMLGRGGRALLWLGSIQFAVALATDVIKPVFGRLRPYQAMGQGGGDLWFAGGTSFPSGHAGFYGGLLLPLIVLFPRLWPLWSGVLLLVAVQRVASLQHYASDVAGSIAFASLAALALRYAMAQREDRPA